MRERILETGETGGGGETGRRSAGAGAGLEEGEEVGGAGLSDL